MNLRVASLLVILGTLLAACRTISTTVPVVSMTSTPTVYVVYPDDVRITDAAQASFDTERTQRRIAHAARSIEPSEAMAVDPDRAAVLRYGRFTDEDVVANDLLHDIGGRTWNGVYTAMTFALGEAMVHMDTTMQLRSTDARAEALRVGAQYLVSMPSVTFDRVDTTRTCSVRVLVTYVPTDSVLLDTVVVADDRGGVFKLSFDRGGSWSSAIKAAGFAIGGLLPERIKATHPRYVERARIMRERKAWFVRHLATREPDDELLYALSYDSLQPPDAYYHWMLRSPDGMKALVAAVATFPATNGLRYMRSSVGPAIVPEQAGDTARLAWTLYAMERVEDRWLFGRVQTVFRASPTYDSVLLHDLLFDALRPLWYNANDGAPSGTFWDEHLFRRIDGIPLLKRRHLR